MKTPKNPYKILESAVSDTLLMSGFQIFAADASLDFFLAFITKKKAPSSPDFGQKT